MLPNGNPLLLGSARIPDDTYLTSIAKSVGSSSTTFSDVNLGQVHDTRHIVVSVWTYINANRTVNAVTIGGVSATKVREVINVWQTTAMFIGAVPTGSSGNIVVNFSNTVTAAGIGVWGLYDLASSTPDDTGSGFNTSPISTVLTRVSPNSSIIAAGSYDTGATITSELNYDQDFEEVNASSQMGFGGSRFLGPSGNVVVSTTFSTSSPAGQRVMYACWHRNS